MNEEEKEIDKFEMNERGRYRKIERKKIVK
jgi:hypothetical protein